MQKKDKQIPPFYPQQNLSYVLSLQNSKDLHSIGKYLTEHLKIAGAYWLFNGLKTLRIKMEDLEEILAMILILQVPIMLFLFFQILIKLIINYVSSLQQQNGSFFGDKWGQIDTRFSYCAVSCLALVNGLNKINQNKAAQFVLKCKNFDGSFGGIPDAQSHAAYVFCCVGTLKILGKINQFDQQLLSKWLCQRQTQKGGFNGRPQKLPDVCYSWWIYSSFCMMDKLDWINQKALENFILACQDIQGGIGDRPGNNVDVFHTFFGLAALSLLDPNKYKLQQINPIYAIPKKIINKLDYLKIK